MTDHLNTSMTPDPHILRNKNFFRLLVARTCSTTGNLMLSVTLGWQVYVVARLTHTVAESAFYVGLLGLIQFLPMFALALIAGEAADRYDRRRIMQCCYLTNICCAIGFTFLALHPSPSLLPIFLIVLVFGVSRAFMMPAGTAVGPMLVERRQMPKAIAWLSLSQQSGMIIGPWVAGFLCTVSAALSYGIAAVLFVTAATAVTLIRANTKPESQSGSRLLLIREGLHYVWTNKIVFGAISLDLFAVLLGGATALLPVFARDVLHVGADGFGILRAGPAIGAAAMMIYLSMKPLERRAGMTMFVAVGIFGLATIVFALSKSLALSVAALAVLGAADAISVFVRQSLVQIVTPDAMRGRVSAVSGLFISASNELGEFESGFVARLLGPIGAAIFGGVGSLVVTGLWAKMFPDLRKADRLTDPKL